MNRILGTLKEKALVILVILLSLSLLGDYIYYQNRLYPGVFLKGEDLGGKTLLEAREIVGKLKITFKGPGAAGMSMPLQEIGINPAVEEILKDGYSRGRELTWPLNLYRRYRLKQTGTFLKLRYKLDRELLEKSLTEIAGILSSKPANARFVLQKETAKLVPEKPGYSIDEAGLKKILLQALNREDLPLSADVPFEVLPPDMGVQNFIEKGLITLISSFATEYDPTATNRVHNLKLAAAALNNYQIPPGEIFSVNNVIGDTTAEKGYKEAPILIGGELVPGMGGGLCQISTTLYNAALLANLEIIERHKHQVAVPYIPAGRDATISYSASDLKFRNNKKSYLQIITRVKNNKVLLGLIGSPMEERVEIETREIASIPPPQKFEIDPELSPGEEEVHEGTPGYVVEVWRKTLLNSEEQSSEKISYDTYNPYPTIIRQGKR